MKRLNPLRLCFKAFKLLFVICVAYSSYAQQDAQFTQYMYNTSVINPAYAGSRGAFSVNALHRTQWVGINGAPTTQHFDFNTPVGKNIGLGFAFINDKIGPAQESLVNADFSYTLNLNQKTKIAFGIKGGLSVLDVDFNELIFDPLDPNSENINDRISPTVGFGIYLHDDEKWYLGLSSPNLLKTQHYREDVQNSEITEEIHAYFIGGYVFDISSNTRFKPAFLAKAVTGAPMAFDVSTNFLFYNKFTLGAAYRLDAAISGLAAFQLSEQLLLGYAYDYDTTELGNYSKGSHEIFLRFEIIKRKPRTINPRFF